jgi:hypothetical protein
MSGWSFTIYPRRPERRCASYLRHGGTSVVVSKFPRVSVVISGVEQPSVGWPRRVASEQLRSDADEHRGACVIACAHPRRSAAFLARAMARGVFAFEADFAAQPARAALMQNRPFSVLIVRKRLPRNFALELHSEPHRARGCSDSVWLGPPARPPQIQRSPASSVGYRSQCNESQPKTALIC